MKSLTNKALLASVLGVVFLTACGGGSSSSGQVPVTDTPMLATSIAATEIVKYMDDLKATASEASEPKEIGLVTMETDDTAEPGAV